jgi:hypothetical protein
LSRSALLALSCLGLALACGTGPEPAVGVVEAPPSEAVAGGLYSVQDEGGFGVVKLLVVDEHAAHVRVYTNAYPSRPQRIDPRELSMGGGGQSGIGHLPLSRATFDSWSPQLIQVEPVTDDELDGYGMWKEAGGGLF